MGVVQRQAGKRSIIAYFGAAVGIVSQLWIYPLAFGAYGDYMFILSMIAFFVPLASFGVLGLNNRFFPYFELENRGNGFLSLLFVLAIIFFLFFLMMTALFQDQYYGIVQKAGFDVDVFKRYNSIIIVGTFFSIIASLFATFSANIRLIVVPFILTTLSWKIFLPILFLLLAGGLLGQFFFF